jgi:hypothetical protein
VERAGVPVSVDYSPGSEVALEDRPAALIKTQAAYCAEANKRFHSHHGHVLISNHHDVDVTVVAATGEARRMLVEFLKTIPPKGQS